MKSRFLAAFTMLLASVSLFAAGPVADHHIDLENRVGQGIPMAHANWVTKAAPSQLEVSLNAESSRSGAYPAVLLETSSYAYEAGDEIEVFLTIRPNGFAAPVTMYLYQQDRSMGTRTYYNVFGGFAAPGTEVDLFGSAGSPIAVNPLAIEDFELFGANGALGGAISVSADMVPARLQHVLEIRSADGSKLLSRSVAKFNLVDDILPVSGNITSNATLSWNNAYVLQGAVFVRSGATLTIQPGTIVFGETQSLGTLVIDRGGKIMARGTNSNPIIMTSEQPVGLRGRADWGGLIINGFAPVNLPGGTGTGEGDTGTYGGTDPADNSGVLKYVRVEYAGIEFSPDNELNGIAFQGVGNGTQVDHIQVHFNKDDGVEFFGGTVNAKYVLLTGNADDSIDWVEGWVGALQYGAVIHSPDDADQGIEADNKSSNNNLLPRSNPWLSNLTLVGQPGGDSDIGILVREGTAGKILNSIVMGFNVAGVQIVHPVTYDQAEAGELLIAGSIFFSDPLFADQEDDPEDEPDIVGVNEAVETQRIYDNFWFGNRSMNPMLAAPMMLIQPDLTPLEGSPALDARFLQPLPDAGGFDTSVDFIGAVGPGDNWVLDGWATFSLD